MSDRAIDIRMSDWESSQRCVSKSFFHVEKPSRESSNSAGLYIPTKAEKQSESQKEIALVFI
jgi:hypothetical protein